jgi:transposase
MAPLSDGYRYQEISSRYAGVPQRWLVVYSEARQARVRRSIAKQVQTQSESDLTACKKLCRTPFACEQDARQALETCAQHVQATRVEDATIRAVSRDGQRGRPPQGTAPQPRGYVIEATRASSVHTTRRF